MNEVSIRLAETDEDVDIARELCREWLDWHWKAYPKDWPVEGNPLDPEKFELVVADLHNLHARPKGAIVIASLDDHPVGCVMYNQAGPGVAEFKRMFVSEGGRGHGIGRLMLDRMFEQMIADGYETVFFSSAKFLIHARAMYESAGFSPIPHKPGFPEAWRDYVYFMERSLVRP